MKKLAQVLEGQFRQGDVLFLEIGSAAHKACSVAKGAPASGVRKSKRASGHILEGEATGHIHRVAELDRAEVFDCGEGLYMNVGPLGASIIHEEHEPIALPPGDYEVVRQREYSPEAIRNVAD
jgi:hypothetical protein